MIIRTFFRHLASESAHSSLYAEMMHILSQIMLERRREKSNDSVIQLLQQTDDPEMLAYVLSGALIGTFYWWQEKNYDVSIEHVIEFANERCSRYQLVVNWNKNDETINKNI